LPKKNHMANKKSNIQLALAVAIFLCALYLFAKSRSVSTHPTLKSSDVIAEMRSRAASAVADARDTFSADLDYSSDSIEEVERILDKIHQQHLKNPIGKSELNRLGLKWGGYVGEVIKRVKKAEWQLDSKVGGPASLPIVYEKSGESFPVSWCLKRIVNGDEDNVWSKFNVLVLNRDSESITFSPEEAVDGFGTSDEADGQDPSDGKR
jgi:hypothetical protein